MARNQEIYRAFVADTAIRFHVSRVSLKESIKKAVELAEELERSGLAPWQEREMSMNEGVEALMNLRYAVASVLNDFESTPGPAQLSMSFMGKVFATLKDAYAPLE